MKLNLELIREITTGAVRVCEESGFVCFYRFTDEQAALYEKRNADFYKKCFATSGVKLLFKTDSKSLGLAVRVSSGSSRSYFSFDVFADGKKVDCLDNFSGLDLPADYTKGNYTQGDFSKNFQIGEGIKTICVYFPWSARAEIKEITVDDGAFIRAVKPTKKLLAYGDSITQGYDALRPSNRYIAKLADRLDAEEFNKGIGGEIFFPALAELKDGFVPDYITVAYGTNDWNCTDEETFKDNCREFYKNIRENYPDTPIFAITPILRKDMCEERIFGDFEKVEADIRECVKDIENITVIRGFDFVPEEEKYFADLRLHPNDEGFEYYFKNLYSEIEERVK